MPQTPYGIGSWAGANTQSALQPSITRTGAQTGGPQLNQYFNQFSPASATTVNLSSGANTITVPTQAGAVTIVMPAGNTQTCTFKGVSGDTGVPIGKTGYLQMIFDNPPPANFVLTAGGTINGVQIYFD